MNARQRQGRNSGGCFFLLDTVSDFIDETRAIAQTEPAPNQYAQDDWEGGGKPALTNTHVGSDRATQITRQQDRAQHVRARNQIDDRAAEQHDAQRQNHAFGHVRAERFLPPQLQASAVSLHHLPGGVAMAGR